MAKRPRSPHSLGLAEARRIWIAAQGLDRPAPFGSGPAATTAAVEQLGYVQIDTINVVERCHHHILWNRIPDYRRSHLRDAQAVSRTVFEYWTHALSYLPVRDYRFVLPAMRAYRADPGRWFSSVGAADVRRVVERIRREGPLSIRDIDDDVLVDKDHPWASRKPSKRALELAFFRGELVVSARDGIVKTYDLAERHFGWTERPRPATARQVAAYRLDRALRAQGVVSLDSICHLDAPAKEAVAEIVEERVRARTLVPVALEGCRTAHWAMPEALDARGDPPALVHVLSPFDPLVIQRRRLSLFFGYDHLFEAYLPKEKRKLGYFALPILVGDAVVAAIDVKADRAAGCIRIQQWTWVGPGNDADHRTVVEDALGRFEAFQFERGPSAGGEVVAELPGPAASLSE